MPALFRKLPFRMGEVYAELNNTLAKVRPAVYREGVNVMAEVWQFRLVWSPPYREIEAHHEHHEHHDTSAHPFARSVPHARTEHDMQRHDGVPCRVGE